MWSFGARSKVQNCGFDEQAPSKSLLSTTKQAVQILQEILVPSNWQSSNYLSKEPQKYGTFWRCQQTRKKRVENHVLNFYFFTNQCLSYIIYSNCYIDGYFN